MSSLSPALNPSSVLLSIIYFCGPASYGAILCHHCYRPQEAAFYGDAEESAEYDQGWHIPETPRLGTEETTR